MGTRINNGISQASAHNAGFDLFIRRTYKYRWHNAPPVNIDYACVLYLYEIITFSANKHRYCSYCGCSLTKTLPQDAE